MADAGAAVAAAGGADAAAAAGAANGGMGSMLFGIVRSVVMYYVINSFMKGALTKPNGMGANVDPAASMVGVGQVPGSIPGGGRVVARPLYVKGEALDMWAYITHDPIFTQYGDADAMVGCTS
jgi:hypothetical protein